MLFLARNRHFNWIVVRGFLKIGNCEKPLANQWLIKRVFFKHRDKLVMLT